MCVCVGGDPKKLILFQAVQDYKKIDTLLFRAIQDYKKIDSNLKLEEDFSIFRNDDCIEKF